MFIFSFDFDVDTLQLPQNFGVAIFYQIVCNILSKFLGSILICELNVVQLRAHRFRDFII